MLSKHPTTKKTTDPALELYQHVLFWPVVALAFGLWCGYRVFFRFPVWFDETIGKAVFFGLPFWLYLTISRRHSLLKPLDLNQFETGLFLGLAVGGVYGFTASILSLMMKGGIVHAAPIFVSGMFWYEFALAILTGFWESLFFFVFLAGAIEQKYGQRQLGWQVAVTLVLFLLFHLPNMFLRAEFASVLTQLFLLSLFGLGQGLLFFRWRNIYALTLSQAIWGMALLLHTGL